jgi:polyphosphate kinase
MNSLTDRDFAFDLMNAAKAGVCVELIVRGSCIVPSIAPTKKNPGYLRVRSVIGRFLEHSRVYLFQSGRSKHLFLSSADLMSRNMHGRIEIAWPIEDRKLIKRIEHECFENYFEDTETSWELHPDGKYIEIKNLRAKQIKSGEKVRIHDAQQTLMFEHGFLSRKSS